MASSSKIHRVPRLGSILSLNNPAMHLSLEGMDARGHFRRLAHVPKGPFRQPDRDPLTTLFRLSWGGHARRLD
jgi:hypothetical protein